MTLMRAQERPGVVTFVGIVLYISAAISAVSAIVVFIDRNDAVYQATTGRTSTELILTAIVEGIIAILLVFVASGVLTGMRGARLLVALVYGIRMVVAAYWMLSYQGGGFGDGGILTIGIGIFVLWALYGHAESARYFAGRMAKP